MASMDPDYGDTNATSPDEMQMQTELWQKFCLKNSKILSDISIRNSEF